MRQAPLVLAGGLAALLVAACGKPETAAPPPEPTDFITAAVTDTSRLAEARVRDALRKPAEVIAFSGIQPGHTVVEIQPAGGYYTALLSRVVGPQGRVIAIDSERVFEYMPRLREEFSNFITKDPRVNVEYSAQRLDELSLPPDVDQVWMIDFYHDTVWTEVDRAAMNKSFFEHLKPGGVYLVIDHRGPTGADDSIAKELHRIDADGLRAEVEAAGFVLQSTSNVLAHPDDPHTDSIFDEARRGRTDQFVFKFVKPTSVPAESAAG